MCIGLSYIITQEYLFGVCVCGYGQSHIEIKMADSDPPRKKPKKFISDFFIAQDLHCMDDDEWTGKEYGAYTMANKLANATGVQLCIPRLAARQIHRNNVAANNAVD
ncbi:hypothetical protein HOLleu_25416 [Holothuria leucospilota]|uniref:Uncharacterized protein n=1 Tax=Holothuria leucospilota TaxID=206669 RepID=A0A9Q1BSZ3_HOLLE|nr:hypothetical protein HOLleu_25416 [Holothuria leucospilota]